MDAFLQDLRYALRSLAKTPAFTLAAVTTLALGIGATTAIFSTVNAALLRPPPYPRARDLIAVRTTLTDGRVTSGLLAPVEITRLNDPRLSVIRAAGAAPLDATLLRDGGTPIHVLLYGVTEGFFDLFGLPLALGSGLAHEHHVVAGPGSPFTVILSHRVWTEMFGSDPNIVGKVVRFAEFSSAVAGVAARDFDTPHGNDFWFNLRLDPQGLPHFLEGYLRARPVTNPQRRRTELSGVMPGLAHDF